MTKTTPRIIGRKVHVSFPGLRIVSVPAKVDTGADNSAIWASDIVEDKGVLSFVLFAKSSRYYTGERISTANYKLLSVKNSFGVSELRYTVKIPAVIEDRTIRIGFTLADRSKGSAPILIGRKTLRGKFLVDVAHEAVSQQHHLRKVLFLSTIRSENVKAFTEAVEGRLDGVKIDRATYDDLIFVIRDGDLKISLRDSNTDIASYDIVHYKTSVVRDVTAACARYCQGRGVRVLDPIVAFFPTTSKLYEYSILCQEGIPIPDTVFTMPNALVGSYALYESMLGVPFVLKGVHSSKGDVNEVIHSKADFDKVAKEAQEQEIYLLGQTFVENKGDYRVLVLGKTIELVMYRSRSADSVTHLNNTSKGGRAVLVNENTLPFAVRRNCIVAVSAMGRDVAGVDMVYDERRQAWYCFEVNDGPQIATGEFLEKKRDVFAQFLSKELDR